MVTQARTQGQKRVMEIVKNFAKCADKTVDDAPRINLNAFDYDAEQNPIKPNQAIGLEGLPKDGLDKFNSGSNSSRINNLFRQANNFSLSDDPSPNELMHFPNDTPLISTISQVDLKLTGHLTSKMLKEATGNRLAKLDDILLKRFDQTGLLDKMDYQAFASQCKYHILNLIVLLVLRSFQLGHVGGTLKRPYSKRI